MQRLVSRLGLACLVVSAAANSQEVPNFSAELQGISETPAQAATGAVIGEICPQGAFGVITLDQDLQDRCNEIVVGGLLEGNDIDGAQAGLQAMADEEDSVVQNSQVDTSGTPVDAIVERLGNVRAGVAGPTSLTLRLDGSPPITRPLLGSEGDGASGLAAGAGLGGWGFFVDGGFATGDRDATRRESGFDMDAVQVTAGADYRLPDGAIVGAAVGYQRIDAELDLNAGEAETDNYSIFGYASYSPSAATYVDAIVGYSIADISQERNIRYSIAALGGGTTTVDQTAFSDTESDEFSARLVIGYDFFNGDWTYGPYGRIEYARVEIDEFRETIPTAGPGSGLAVEIDEQDFTSVPLALGVQASKAVDTGWGTLFPRAFFEYVHEFKNDREDITGRFVGDPTGTTFFIPTDSPDRNFFNAGASVHALLGGGKSVHVAYQTLLGHKDLTIHAIEAGFRIEF